MAALVAMELASSRRRRNDRRPESPVAASPGRPPRWSGPGPRRPGRFASSASRRRNFRLEARVGAKLILGRYVPRGRRRSGGTFRGSPAMRKKLLFEVRPFGARKEPPEEKRLHFDASVLAGGTGPPPQTPPGPPRRRSVLESKSEQKSFRNSLENGPEAEQKQTSLFWSRLQNLW